jgi:hypothetical protein
MNIYNIILRIETTTPNLVLNTYSILIALGTPVEPLKKIAWVLFETSLQIEV